MIEAYAYAAGRSSIRVRLQAYREHPLTGERERTTDSCFVFVAVNEEMHTTTVPELTIESDRCQRLRDEALSGEHDGD